MRLPNVPEPQRFSVTAIVTCMTDSEAPYVGRAVRSVREQTHPTRLRLYVAEDNRWIEALLPDLMPEEVRRIPRQNVAAVRNLGVREADTSHIAFLDGDDWWLSDKIEHQLAAVRKTGAVFVGGSHLMVDESGECFAYGLSRHLPMTSSWLACRNYMLAYPFDDRYEVAEDAMWWVRMVRHPGRKLRMPQVVMAYRVRMNSKSESSSPRRRKLFLLRITRKPPLRRAVRTLTFVMSALCRSDRYVPLGHWPVYPPPTPVTSDVLGEV